MEIDRPRPGSEPGLQALWQAAFGDSENWIRLFFSRVYRPERCRCLTMDGQIPAALYWFDTEYAGQKLAYVYAVATAPAYRRRGLCRQLMADTQAHLARLGYAAVLLVPAEPELRRMYAAMGYRECSRVSELTCTAGAPVSIREVSREEYAALRRKYLPAGGVVQEGANLACLSLLARLYAGEDFLLAADREEGCLRGNELLGNPAAAAGILSALGCSQGSFRIPGQDIPFSMALPLAPEAALPDYFGLAFD